MTQAQSKTYLSDYSPPAFLISDVELTFHLAPRATKVISKIHFYPNPKSISKVFELNGEMLALSWCKIDGQAVTPHIHNDILRCDAPDRPFVWEAEVVINPEENTALSGLYISNGMYCTQCEAEGFRRITFYPDRPDVMAPFRVSVHGDAPVLLSNGNLMAQGKGWAQWHDPFAKPSYLFALVAGDLRAHSDHFITQSGRDVALNIYVRKNDLDKCDFAMQALKSAMLWDEQTYGREYDLDVFNIVAVDDFNMGAMENKGLNIFNSAAVLANPQTATDANFERIEAIIAHEYFHNWTGNRITCRDWFQLSLKEGLTVFRDQQFSADMRSSSVRRIEDVSILRAAQFREDSGPLAHPVQPKSYVEINNFYTATIYEKGAELIRMLRLIVGDQGYEKALDLYFKRHDGQACTIEDWLKVFEDATGQDLRHFSLWYHQAGTPVLSVKEEYGENQEFCLHLRQNLPPTAAQTSTKPMVIPIALGVLDSDTGRALLPTRLVTLDKQTDKIDLGQFDKKPTVSILRGFSAPVLLRYDMGEERLLCQFCHDSDPYNRWNAGRQLALQSILAQITQADAPHHAYINAFAKVLQNDALEPAYRALCARLPSEDDIANALFDKGKTPDPLAIYDARHALKTAIAQQAKDILPNLYAQHQISGAYRPDAQSAGARALGNAALGYISTYDGGAAAQKQYETASNMTQKLAALACLIGADCAGSALLAFYQEWQHERLVLDKWFALQISLARPADVLQTLQKLLVHPDYTPINPNRVRAVLGSFANMPTGFHAKGGAGYDIFADQLIHIDTLNPQLAARLCGAFETFGRYDDTGQAHARAAMRRVADQKTASKDTREMLSRLLEA